MKWEAHIRQRSYAGGIVLNFARHNDEKSEVLSSYTVTTIPVGQIGPADIPPFAEGEEAIQFLQTIMDAAYEHGLRPSRAQDERHQAEHLKDMRQITRHLLKMEK